MTPALLSAVLLTSVILSGKPLIAASVVYIVRGYAPKTTSLYGLISVHNRCQNKQITTSLRNHIFRLPVYFLSLLLLFFHPPSQSLLSSSLDLFVRAVPLCLSHSADRHSLARLYSFFSRRLLFWGISPARLLPSDYICFRWFGCRGITPSPACESHPACPTPS